jgi:hypothetical protein
LNALTITFCGRAMSPAQWLGLMGVWQYCYRKRPDVAGALSASSTFDQLVGVATKRGFTERRLLKAAMRTGKVGPTALARCEAVIALLEPGELMQAVATANWWLESLSLHPAPSTWMRAA